ncbi:outer membrane protein assembly factor BamB family protein [Halapricum hydrolyticum]|uniref:PQQ-like beta-propeller repeat protein n=1 Tax=Halapricum hydrolyticum TaxID=2979991 RepID=A0AAE3IA13_9EURY|nr:PQQ-binding-like beta-propeller repeat protein [Halapricum hydrolyticum]MCU4716581.1 PQQ-like beta-propeller repeat protein [Halapricum hydrolyticum]MCU4725814.1 PQQ-like beta-propeller repeat protein [Halapricum hydrolyticum]
MGTFSRGVTRRRFLGTAGASMAATTGCLDSAEQSTPVAWPQRGYDAGATFYKTEGSPPVEDAEVVWTANVDNSLYAAIDEQWRGAWEQDRYRDLTNQRYIATFANRYGRTPLIVVGDRAHVQGGKDSVVDLTDGTVVEQSNCAERALVGAARTNTYRDGVIVGTGSSNGSDCRDRCVVLKGFRPPDGGAWCKGPQRWAAGAPRDLASTAAAGRIADGMVVTVTPDREPPYRIVAIDADDGRIEWENTVPHGVHRLRVDDGVAYASVAGEAGGTMTILDGASTHQRVEIGPTDLLEAVRDDVSYFRDLGAKNKTPSIKAIDTESGETRQLLDGPAVSERIAGTPAGVGDIVVGPDRLFATLQTETGSDPAILALDRSDGAVEWVRQLSGPLRLTGTDDALYVAGSREPGPHAYALDPASGDRLWSVELPDRTGFGRGVYRPAVVDSKMLVPLSGLLVALEEP